MRRTLLAALLAAVAVLLAACVAPQYDNRAQVDPADVPGDPAPPGAVRHGGELVMGLSAEPDKLDPTTSSSLYTRYVMSSICEKLFDIDAAGNLVPQLATALPTVTDGGLTVSFPVRSTGVRFADGTPFDAAAVVTSLQRHLTLPGSQRKSELGSLRTITADGPDRVTLRFARPFAPITAALADRAGMIMSPAALAAEGTNFSQRPVCVGPFRFVDRVAQTAITVERDPLYYDAAAVPLDRITYRIMSDAGVRAANLRSGDIQVADSISPQDVDALARESDVRVTKTLSLGYQAVTFNSAPKRPEDDTPLAHDPRIRLAFSKAVDRARLADVVFNGWYTPACSPISPNTDFGAAADVGCPAYDPAGARALLAQAGVPVPFPITMQTSNTADSLRLAQALQAAVADAGFDLRIEPVEYSTLLDVQTDGTFSALQLGWSGRIDPDGNTTRFLTTGAGANYGDYADPEVDRLLADAAATFDTAARTRLYAQATEQVQRDNPLVYLYRQRNLTAARSEVLGVQTFADGVVRLSRAGFARTGGTP
ncbi:ABC transporter substrate-binding protein [Actinomycetospora sp. NBRC 106378]|uniref:ABC transporter substrate-binding protein n=1 Tax=Actinomycetospora sp. NBRC 106378 TaxID=3032208 RepID=UPI0024A32B4A|nr:ABC transporter substrate-binding protein [Actinomycetospora sp. NBRC 106378]GLZ54418.1 ABC transporter substrate-binding protein [Actinomycetospora sp. NBRC 106378]